MKAPLSWIKDFVKVEESAQELAVKLQLSGNKVENVEKSGEDAVFEFEITPNRPDTLAVLGIAREVGAIYNLPVSTPKTIQEQPTQGDEKSVQISVEEKTLCPFYSIGTITDIKVSESPEWIKNRLAKIGIRSLNNVVDITNYVMHETGQPMHAFDFDKIKGPLNLRSSKKGEKITTLDDTSREIPEGSIVIEDKEKIIDLAGLMGGKNSEVDDNTSSIVLHTPIYDRLAIRMTSQKLGLRTEASNRFEKKLDPNGHRFAFERALYLILKYADGRISSNIKSVHYPKSAAKINLNADFLGSVTGLELSSVEVVNILKRLNFLVAEQGKNLQVTIPTYRTDIQEEIDLVEEVSRIYGYNNFQESLPTGEAPKHNLSNNFEKDLKTKLTNLGLHEVYSSSLTSAASLEKIGVNPTNTLRVSNRLVVDYEYLRPNLYIGLLEAAQTNIKERDQFSLFEVGKVFIPQATQSTKLPLQPKKTAGIFVDYRYRDAKGVIESLLRDLNIGSANFRNQDSATPFVSIGEVVIGDQVIGAFGRLDAETRSNYELPENTYMFQLDNEEIRQSVKQKKFTPDPKYPVVKENISLFVPENLTYKNIDDAVSKRLNENLYSLKLLEDAVIKGKRSLLLQIQYYNQNKTLETTEIENLRKKCLHTLTELGVEIRED